MGRMDGKLTIPNSFLRSRTIALNCAEKWREMFFRNFISMKKFIINFLPLFHFVFIWWVDVSVEWMMIASPWRFMLWFHTGVYEKDSLAWMSADEGIVIIVLTSIIYSITLQPIFSIFCSCRRRGREWRRHTNKWVVGIWSVKLENAWIVGIIGVWCWPIDCNEIALWGKINFFLILLYGSPFSVLY